MTTITEALELPRPEDIRAMGFVVSAVGAVSVIRADEAYRLKAELQALVGPEGPSAALLEDKKQRFPPPSARTATARATPAKNSTKKGSKKAARGGDADALHDAERAQEGDE